MRVFFFIDSLKGGGAERVTANLSKSLAWEGYEVGVITMCAEDLDFYQLDRRVRRISLDLAGVNQGLNKLIANYRRLRALRRCLQRERPDVLVAFMTTSIVSGIIASIGLPVRVYGSERNNPASRKPGSVWAILRRLFYRFADGHISQTERTAAWLQNFTAARNVKVIPNPVVWPIQTFPPEVPPEQLIATERKILLAVGSSPVLKGFDLLLEAFAKVSSGYLDWDLVILGIDSTSYSPRGGGASVQRQGEALGIEDRLILPGRVGNITDWYQRADLFVLSSRSEGFPNVLIEAMASGCPSIAFDCDTGPSDIIKNGVNGVLIRPEDIEELGSGIALLMGNESLREKYGKAGLKVRETFSEDKIVGLWEKAIAVKK